MRFGAGSGAYRLLTAGAISVGVVMQIPLLWLTYTRSSLWGVAVCALGIGNVWFIRKYPRRFVRSFYGVLEKRAVTVRVGVWWKREIRMPLSQLRTFERWTLPFARFLDCSFVILRFAGGTVRLPFLPREQAQRLTRCLSEGSP